MYNKLTDGISESDYEFLELFRGLSPEQKEEFIESIKADIARQQQEITNN